MICRTCDENPLDGEPPSHLSKPVPSIHKRGADGKFKCPQSGCDYKAKKTSHLKEHLAFKHDIGVQWFECDQPGCDYKAKKKSRLKEHLAYKHDIGVEWFECDQPGCDYKAKHKSDLTRHLAFKHDIGVEWFECDQPGCDYKAKQKCDLKQHLADRHDIGVQWFECDQSGCHYKAKHKGALKQHLADKHDIGVQWFECDQPGCDHKSKHKGALKQHLADKHDIGVQWFECDQPGCDYKSKHKGALKQHLADKHDIGVQWFECDQPGCDYKAKKKGRLDQHLASMHFSVYCQRKRIQEERVREALLAAGWLEWSSGDTLPPAGHFKREHQIDFKCAQASADKSFCRIDFVLSYEGGAFVFLEVDEHQHRFGYAGSDGAGISCDSKRMANVQTSLTLEFVGVGAEAPPIYWLRYNPHEWYVDGALCRVSKAEREGRLCAFLERLEPTTGIGYAFYDYDEATGLDILAAEEFPEVFRDLVDNLKDLPTYIL